MDEADVVAGLERLFAATSASDVRRAFSELPWLGSSIVRDRLVLEQRASLNPEAQRSADVRLALWAAGARGDFEQGWAEYTRNLITFVEEVLIPRSEALRARIAEHLAAEDWSALLVAGTELLHLADGGPPEFEYDALRAIAHASFEDRSTSRGESLDAAIRCWERILEIIDHHSELSEGDFRAVALTNLGTALGARVYGDPRVNQERAIRCHKSALELMSIESDGDGWAMAHTNLGLSLLHHAEELRGGLTDPRELGLPEEDLDERLRQADEEIEEAITHFDAALSWRSFQRNPRDWAFTETNLGLAYTRRRIGERRPNLESAIAHFREGERGFRVSRDPHLQAIALHDLASEVLHLAELEDITDDERASLLAEALAFVEAAVAARSLEDAPVEAGRAHYLKGGILVASGRRAEAIAAYQAALKGLTPSSAPRNCRETARRLAELAISVDDWVTAADAWETAVEAAASAFALRSTSAGRFDELAQNLNIHRWAAFAAVRAGRPQRAVELLESGRSRELSRRLTPESEDLSVLRERRPKLAKSAFQNEPLASRSLRQIKLQPMARKASWMSSRRS
jgi:tetratricopeptide (TPR) repeat protein